MFSSKIEILSKELWNYFLEHSRGKDTFFLVSQEGKMTDHNILEIGLE